MEMYILLKFYNYHVGDVGGYVFLQHYRKTRFQHGNHHVGDVGGYCFLQHYRKTRLPQPLGLPNWETFTMLEMLEVIFLTTL